MSVVRVGQLGDIPPLGGRCVKTAVGPIGVFRTIDDRVFAIHNRCPHQGGPLSEGIVHGTEVTCPLHNMVISLKTGRVEGPDEGAVETVPVHVAGGEVYLALPKHPLGRSVEPRASRIADQSAETLVEVGADRVPKDCDAIVTRSGVPAESA